MKIKTLSFAILSSILLSACGGGSSSSDSDSSSSITPSPTDNKPANQTWTQIELSQGAPDSTSGALGYDKSIITIKDGIYYAKNESNLETDSNGYQSFFVTKDGIYEDGPTDSIYGINIGTVQGSPEKLSLKPYSQIGSKGLVFTKYHKVFDISGQPLNAKVNPYDNWLIKNNVNSQNIDESVLRFYNLNQSKKFPAGSKCLVLTKAETNQEYLELYNDTLNDPEYSRIWNLEAIKSANDSTKIIYKDTTAYITFQYQEYDAYAKVKNDIFAGYKYDQGIEYLLSEEIADLKDQINQNNKLSNTEKLKLMEYPELANNACILYNETATKTINQAIGDFK